MAMVTCRECKKSISADAKICPHCGARNPARKSGVGAGKVIVAVVALGLVSAVYQGAQRSPASGTDSSGASQAVGRDASGLAEVEGLHAQCARYIGRTADSVLQELGKAGVAPHRLGEDDQGLIVVWTYPDCVFTMRRSTVDGVAAYRVDKAQAR